MIRFNRIGDGVLAFRFSCVLVILGYFAHAAQAQVSLDRFFPPVVAVGAETPVTCEGKFPKWPPEFECDSSDVSLSTQKESGKLTVKIEDDASPGVAWIRFFDDQSATSLVPLVLSPVAVFVETEPNDKRSQANQLTLPTVVAGRLSKNGDSDAYRVSVLAGQTLVVSATANQVLASPMDAVLQLTDLRGNVLVQSDDVRGLDPQIVFIADSDQEFLIRIFAFPETPNSTVGFAGSAAFVYSLDVTAGPFVDHVAGDRKKAVTFGYNLEVKNPAVSISADIEDATSISPPVASIPGALGWSWILPTDDVVNQVLPGAPFDGKLPAVLFEHFTKPDETHLYKFVATKGTKYRAEVRSKADGFLLDSKLTINDQKSGKTLASNDDVSRGRYDAGVDFTAVDDGTIEVTISELLGGFGPRHFYQLSIRQAQPRCLLSVAEEHFVVNQDKPLEITVTVKRTSGFNQKVKVIATDLPKGVISEPVVSEPKGATAKSVKLKLVASEMAKGHGRFRIAGTVLDAKDKHTEDIREATFELRPSIPVTEFWLTVPSASQENAKP